MRGSSKDQSLEKAIYLTHNLGSRPLRAPSSSIVQDNLSGPGSSEVCKGPLFRACVEWQTPRGAFYKAMKILEDSDDVLEDGWSCPPCMRKIGGK